MESRDEDRDTCQRWLEDVGLADRLQAAERWLVAMWSFAVDDAKLARWCRRIIDCPGGRGDDHSRG